MNNIEGKKEKIYLSTLAFLDEDFFETNERYLWEFCKLVIYQNGYEGLSINEICDKINELVLFAYTEEEIEPLSRKWWEYWKYYWRVRGTRDALPKDYACEVTIPVDREAPQGKW